MTSWSVCNSMLDTSIVVKVKWKWTLICCISVRDWKRFKCKTSKDKTIRQKEKPNSTAMLSCLPVKIHIVPTWHFDRFHILLSNVRAKQILLLELSTTLYVGPNKPIPGWLIRGYWPQTTHCRCSTIYVGLACTYSWLNPLLENFTWNCLCTNKKDTDFPISVITAEYCILRWPIRNYFELD